MKTKNRIICIFIIVITLFSASSLNCFAATKTASNYKVFSGTVPDMGILVSWGVNFEIIGDYSNAGVPYRLNYLTVNAYINPKRTDISNGVISGSVTETIDFGNSVSRTIPGSFWSTASGIWSNQTYVYFTKIGSPNKSFYYEAKEDGNFTYSNSAAILYNRTNSLSLSIQTPK